MASIENIVESVRERSYDILGEALLSQVLASDLSPDEIVIRLLGQLKRQWSRDIEKVTIESFDKGSKAFCLNLNRDGIYDSLPQGLFHSSSEKDLKNGKDMADDSVRQRKKEKIARDFFMPFETEILLSGTQLFEHEVELEYGLKSALIEGIISGFWLIDKSVPDQYRFRLNKVLPFASLITGDIHLTQACYEYILGETVDAYLVYDQGFNDSGQGEKLIWRVGQDRLGTDTVCGMLDQSLFPTLVVNIGPILKTPVWDFLQNGVVDEILELIANFFVPSEISVRTNLVFENGLNSSKIDLMENCDCCLGYNSVVGS